MFLDFILKFLTRAFKVTMSYLSWQIHPRYVTMYFTPVLTVLIFIAILSTVL